jgi:hypothetical protein
MIAKIDDHKIKHQPNIEMLKPIIKKRKKLVRPFLRNYFFRVWEKIDDKKMSQV